MNTNGNDLALFVVDVVVVVEIEVVVVASVFNLAAVEAVAAAFADGVLQLAQERGVLPGTDTVGSSSL